MDDNITTVINITKNYIRALENPINRSESFSRDTVLSMLQGLVTIIEHLYEFGKEFIFMEEHPDEYKTIIEKHAEEIENYKREIDNLTEQIHNWRESSE